MQDKKLLKEVAIMEQMVTRFLPSQTNDLINRQFVVDFVNGVGRRFQPRFKAYAVRIREIDKARWEQEGGTVVFIQVIPL